MELTKKGADTRARIVDAARSMFARKGFAATGMRELAEVAEVNPAMINYFFGSKKELLKEILGDFFAGYFKLLEANLVGPEEPDQKIRRFIHAAIEYIGNNRDGMVITLTELPHEDQDITEFRAQWVKKVLPVLQREVCEPLRERKGVILPPPVLGPMLVSMMSSRFLFAPIVQEMVTPEVEKDFLQRYPDLIAGIFLNGINGLSGLTDGEGNG